MLALADSSRQVAAGVLFDWAGAVVGLAVSLAIAVAARTAGRWARWLYGLAWLVAAGAITGWIGPETAGRAGWMSAGFGGLAVLAVRGFGVVELRVALPFAVALASVSLGLLVGHYGWSGQPGTAVVAHVAAVLALLWGLVAAVVVRAARLGGRGGGLAVEVFKVAAMTAGLVVVVLRGFDATVLLIGRILHPYEWFSRVSAPASGLADLLAVVGAVGLWRVCNRSGIQAVSLFWLAVLVVLWAGLMIPVGVDLVAVAWPEWLGWTLWVQAGLSAVVLGFVLAEGLQRRRRLGAWWPDRLELLAEPQSTMPGLREAAGITGMVVLVLGVFHVFAMPTHYRAATGVTLVCAVVVGGSAFALAHRRWSLNLAEVGVANMTLAGAVLPIVLWPIDTARELSPQVPVLLNGVLFGLAGMAWLWHWLAGVWRQQLDDGRAWTTAGRLVSVNLRVGFMVGALGVMLALLMAIWPRFGLQVATADNSPQCWATGIAGCLLLVVVLAWSACRTGKGTLAWAALVAAMVLGLFVAVRWPPGGVLG
ncbi:MAG: hypothetical protein ACE5K7_02440, partial [Phycisphaerae bacterium]